MTGPVALSVREGVGLIEADHPPVNTLSAAVRTGLADTLAEAVARPDVAAIVIACAGRTFFAGADIAEFGKPLEGPPIQAVLAAIEASPKPVVAALHGTALGGGFELALACHYRVAAETARVGLPEVLLGVLPGAGGTQRVPRLVGAERALEMLTSGRQVAMGEAAEIGLVDCVVLDAWLRDEAFAFARMVAGRPPPRVRDRTEWTVRDRKRPELFRAFLDAHADRFRGFLAPQAIVATIEAAVTRPFDEGIAYEFDQCERLIASPESAAQRAGFFAERETAKVPGITRATQPRPIRSIALLSDDPVAMRLAGAARAAGLEVRSGADADLGLGGIAPSCAINAVTSDLRKIGDAANVIGLHAPASLGVVEIMSGPETDPAIVAGVFAFARRIGALGVWSALAELPIAERLARARDRAIAEMGEEAARPALAAYGFPSTIRVAPDPAPARPLVTAVAEEASAILRDGAALRASDIDMIAIRALGWPVYRGGPLYATRLHG